ncbi:MAG: aminomethyltransferase [Nitrospinae bacterium CG11_big_fil_rev_8_21_14_0_20_45_15]|nr:MAG: aminomethyltransferase [Nitrospinae bacterium CG11_big_fil_rev_8_21_14_0_20_45_15]
MNSTTGNTTSTLETSVLEEYLQVRKNCGRFQLSDYQLFGITGADVFSFLQTQTTNDVHLLKDGQGQDSAIVDRKGRLIASFSIYRESASAAWIFVEVVQADKLKSHLETYIFREDVTIGSPQHTLQALQGPKSLLILNQIIPNAQIPEKYNSICVQSDNVVLIQKSLTGEEGYLIGLPCGDVKSDELLSAMETICPESIAAPAREILRVEAGIPLYGKDMTAKNVLPETGLEHTSVSYNKGCYIGQEIIARIKTYGAPNFSLMGLLFLNSFSPLSETDVLLDEKKIGLIKSVVYSPALENYIALAYLHKDWRSPDVELNVTINGEAVKVKTCLLPFYQLQTRSDRSGKLLEEALEIYRTEENLDRPIEILREAIAMDPKHAAAYEALGVFLSRQNKLDEAIALMKRLVEIDPQEIMAHTNLSVYYMQQGRIEDAEFEKGEATAIQFEKVMAQKMSERAKAKDEEKDKLERARKIAMFKEVLEIDPVDAVANFGLGSIFHETKEYEQALAPLQTVVRENKDYSAAYLLLGKTQEQLSRLSDAEKTYRDGIAVASKKGDLMPLKEMQTRLHALTTKSKSTSSV